jgi:hypothetical protein
VEVDAHIDKRHPFCPSGIRKAIRRRIVKDWWNRPRIGRALGIVSENFVRHEMTDYENLLAEGSLSLDEARRAVAPIVREVIRSWSHCAFEGNKPEA